MSLLYRKPSNPAIRRRQQQEKQKASSSSSFMSRFWGRPASIPPPIPEESRPVDRKSFRSLIDTIERTLTRAFPPSSFTRQKFDAASSTAPMPPSRHTAAEIIIIDDDDDEVGDLIILDRTHSEKVKRDKEAVERISAQYPAPDGAAVMERIDAMEVERKEEAIAMELATAEQMDVIPTQQSLELQIERRLQPLDTDQYADAITFLRSNRRAHDVVLIEKYNIPMTEYHLNCLAPTTWLNDEVINFYMSMLQEKDTLMCAKYPNRISSHYFNSFFVTKLLEDNIYTYKNVKRWTKKFDIFSKDKIFCPVNIGNTHWTMCVIHMLEKRIQYYDSMAGQGTVFINALLQYLQDDHMDKKKIPMPDLDQWTVQSCIRNETPQQFNGSDCGMFTILFADFLSEDLPLDFDQQHISTLRNKVCASIMAGKLWYCEELWNA